MAGSVILVFFLFSSPHQISIKKIETTTIPETETGVLIHFFNFSGKKKRRKRAKQRKERKKELVVEMHFFLVCGA